MNESKWYSNDNLTIYYSKQTMEWLFLLPDRLDVRQKKPKDDEIVILIIYHLHNRCSSEKKK